MLRPLLRLADEAIQQHIAPENNTYEVFRPAPTPDPLLINRVPVSVPVSVLPSDPALLQKTIADAVHPATGTAIGNARTLLPWDRITISLVIQVPPTNASLSLRIASYSSTAFARTGRCGRPPPLLNAPSAGNLATQLLAAQKAPPTLSAVASVATPRTQPEPIPAINALENQLCQRRLMVYTLTHPPSASIAMPTTQPTLPLVRSV